MKKGRKKPQNFRSFGSLCALESPVRALSIARELLKEKPY
jgi:hypothetical protein